MAITRYFRQTRRGLKRKRIASARNVLRRFVRRRRFRSRRVPFKLSKYAGFPQKLMMRFRYCRQFSASPGTSGAVTVCQLTPNSLYLPDPSSGSHKPLFYDNMKNIYQSYRVNYWKVKATFLINVLNVENTSVAYKSLLNNMYRVLIQADDTSSDWSANSLTNWEVGKNKFTKMKYLNGGNTSNVPPSISMTCRPWKLTGTGRKDATLAAAMNASPTDLTWCSVVIDNADGSSATIPFTCQIEIDMYTTLFDPIDAQGQNT